MKEDVLDYIRKHPVWYVTLCHYPEKYDDLLDEIHQKKQSTVLEKLERISILMSMLEMLHTDMHPGNIFVSYEHPEDPQYIGIDCGIVGSLNKEDKRYLQFKEQSLKLLNQETKELLDNYQNLLQELDDLKKFEKYIDLTQKRQELNEVRKRMKTFKNIIKVIIKSMNYSMK